MFRCKREHCNFSQCCPFYHSEDEKKTWDKVFSNFIRKDRISYVKDKQKYYEQGLKASNKSKFNHNKEENSPLNQSSSDQNKKYHNRSKTNYSRTPKYVPHRSPLIKPMNDNNIMRSDEKLDKPRNNIDKSMKRKGSGDYFGRNSQKNLDSYFGQKDIVTNGLC